MGRVVFPCLVPQRDPHPSETRDAVYHQGQIDCNLPLVGPSSLLVSIPSDVRPRALVLLLGASFATHDGSWGSAPLTQKVKRVLGCFVLFCLPYNSQCACGGMTTAEAFCFVLFCLACNSQSACGGVSYRCEYTFRRVVEAP